MGLWKRRRRRRRGEEEIEGVGDGGKRRHRGEEEGGGGDGGSWRNCPLLDSERRKLSVSFFLFPLSFFLNFICFLRLIKKYWACNQKKCLAEPDPMTLFRGLLLRSFLVAIPLFSYLFCNFFKRASWI